MRRARAWCWRPLGCPWSSPRSTSASFLPVGGTPSPERCTNFSRAPSSPSCARRLSASSFWGRRWRASVRSSSFAASFSQKSALPPRAWSSGSFTDRAEPSGRLPPGPRAPGRSWGSSIPRPGISSFRLWCTRSTTPRRSSTSAITGVPVRFRKRHEPDARPLRQDRSPRERLLLRKVRRRVLAKPFLQCEKLRLERRPGREGVEEIALLHHRANRVVAGLKGRELARRFLPRPTVGRHFKEAPELEEELVELSHHDDPLGARSICLMSQPTPQTPAPIPPSAFPLPLQSPYPPHR